ncbi:MAG: endolytic transglycosylase MltG [Moraxellaceae bacterium]|nr:endolytic transglycosylase MltG [Moraxellaceae bacterium]
MSEPTAPKKTTKKPSATSKTGIKKPRAKATGATRVKPKTKPTPKSNEVPHPNKKVVLVLSLFLIMLMMVAWVYWSLQRQLDLGDKGYTLQVERGQNYSQVLAKINQDGVIKNLFLAKLYLKVSKAKPLQMGTYLFKEPISLVKLLSQLINGDGLMMTKITVIEGTNFKQLLAQLAADERIKHSLQDKTPQEVLQVLELTETHPEGLFAPDTYIFALNETDVKVLKHLYAQQQKILQQAWQTRADNLPYKTPYEALIMASIVEKETGAAVERPQIAGVFIKRLQLGMRLQTDPTVIYGIGDNYDGNIRKADLLAYTPYNTYKINGLPPTPIALPSKEAIKAALNPLINDNIYFVARGDGSGMHNFSANLAQHNQAVADYLQARKGK